MILRNLYLFYLFDDIMKRVWTSGRSALVRARQRKRTRWSPHIDTIEDQLDIMIHTTQIQEHHK